mmetsp:Transcript_18323/g.44235  ORF Transcript_18323/g.44235 Transcript_18323/m.44235 type:complete len:495 (-) Transcript_18323:93-1577(-)|eukprot:CAMPEP_0113493374 /NCGR_PEP_ID=MMETSP0014_2-20120614/28559_1 /TAXON_ID=2857 /ORGANISM="Nitzschia sp." /LENGTH=494 /DNA_ID=CAMNT_0000387235 /DNA_START=82 /DNA_END=1566 /DNA_ORIENTATION=- /assembly_acc=CAM_ASM_000159
MKSIDVMSGTAGSSNSSSSDHDQAHNQKSMSVSGGNCISSSSSSSSASCDPNEIYVGSFAYLQQQQQHEQHQRWMQQQLQYQQQQQQYQQLQHHAAQQPQHPLMMTMAQNGQTSSATTLWLQQQQQQQQQQCRQSPFPPASMVPTFEAPSRSYSRSSSSSYSSSSDSTTDSSYKYHHQQKQQQQQQCQQQYHHQQHQNEYRPFAYGHNKDMAVPRSAIRSGDRDNSTTNKKLSVSFASMNEVYFNSTDLDEIVTTCWYSRDDLRQFKSERKMIVRMLKSVKFDPTKIDTSIYDLRGLEAYSSIAFNALMQKKRKQVFQAVLNEQGRQRQQQLLRDGGGSSSNQPLPLSLDDESIRDVSSSASKWARERGLELGRADAMLVGNSPFESLNSTTTDDDDDSMVDASDEENDDNDDYESEMAVVEASAAAVVGGRAMPQRMKLLSRDSFSTSCSSESSGSFSLSGDGPDCSFSSSSSSSGSTWAEQLMGEALIPEEE